MDSKTNPAIALIFVCQSSAKGCHKKELKNLPLVFVLRSTVLVEVKLDQFTDYEEG